MRAILKVTPELTIELDGQTQRDLFAEIAGVQEVFANATCKLCLGIARFQFRTVAGNDYAEMVCQSPECRATLSMGMMREGGRLFPQRRLDSRGKPDRKAGRFGTHEGWTHYRGDVAPSAEPEPEPAKPAPRTVEPTKPAAAGRLPESGRELVARIAQQDAQLTVGGRIMKGTLIDFVRIEGMKKGHRGDMKDWDVFSIAWAVDAVNAFVAQLPKQHAWDRSKAGVA